MSLSRVTLDQLLNCGFVRVAEWRRDAVGRIVCEGQVPAEPGVYLFVVGGRIQYVGSALGTLNKRTNSYQRRQSRGNSSRPVHLELAEAVARGDKVTVFTRTIPQNEPSNWNGLPVSLVLGIEAALIADIQPPWNRRGRTLRLDHEAPEDDDESVV